MVTTELETIEQPGATSNWELAQLLSQCPHEPSGMGTATPFLITPTTGSATIDPTSFILAAGWVKNPFTASPPMEAPSKTGIAEVPATTSSIGMTIPLTSIVAVDFGPVTPTPPVLRERLRHLRKLAAGWDSYDSQPITSQAIESAESFLSQVYQLAGSTIGLPFIAPCADGGLELEWHLASGGELLLGIPPAGQPIDFLLPDAHAAGIDGKAEGIISHPAQLLNLVDDFPAEKDKP